MTRFFFLVFVVVFLVFFVVVVLFFFVYDKLYMAYFLIISI